MAQAPPPHEPINSSAESRVTLPGNVPAALRGRPQLGPAAPDLRLERMILALRMRPEAQEQLRRLLADQQDPGSPRYHQWLSPEQFAARFAPSPAERRQVQAWLETQGLKVDTAARGGMSLVCSGDVAAVQRAFRTPMQRFATAAGERLGNALDPSVPAALAPLVQGLVSLNDLRRRPAHAQARILAGPQATYGTSHYLAPADFATIYDLTPLLGAGTDGSGAAIAVIGRSNPGLADVDAFRSAYGLPAGRTSLVLNGSDPGPVSLDEDLEANLDMQWAGAAAPGAAIKFVCSASTATTDGVDLSALYAVDQDLAPVLTVSFGQCEDSLGQAAVDFYENLWAQAAAQGITVCVASGDSGPAGCDPGYAAAGSGPGVNGLASTEYNVCVGGTQFDDAGTGWWAALNDYWGGSALGYIPERAWNESGAVPLGSGLWTSGGGASDRHPKPVWQSGPGVPDDGRRDLPDVSFSAAGHDGYLVRSGGKLLSVGGTSASTPAFAGIAALLVQKTGQRQGNLNPQLYARAALQAQGAGPAVFHDILQGDTNVPGTAGFSATAGYDRATGLGSLDATLLVNGQPGLTLSPAAYGLAGDLGASLSQAFTATGGVAPYRFSLGAGTVPPGLTLSTDGLLGGVLTTAGQFGFYLVATDAQGAQGIGYATLKVGPVQVAAEPSYVGQLLGHGSAYRAQVTGALDRSVTWSASGGQVTQTGPDSATFQADVAGTYWLTASANAAPAATATFQVVVHSAALLAGEVRTPSPLDLLYLAGMMTLARPELDLDGSGRVDPADLDLLLGSLGW